jgi:hypothetical protein
MQSPTKGVSLRLGLGIAVVDLRNPALDITGIDGLVQIVFIALCLSRDVGDKSFDKREEVGHGES